MPTHLSSIGFPLANEDDLYRLVEKIGSLAKPLEIREGFYLCYQDPSGAGLWLHADKDQAITGMNPHFFGPSQLPVKLVRSLHQKSNHVFEGSYFAWAQTQEHAADQEGAYPFLFDAPDYLCHMIQAFPRLVSVQVAAFAHQVKVYGSEATFHAEDASQNHIAAEAFVPAGLMQAEEQEGKPEIAPSSHALINGHVKQAELRVNSLTGQSFWWIQVASYGGLFDVVADPQSLNDKPRVGDIISGSFWLSGLIQEANLGSRLGQGFKKLLRGSS